MTDKPPKDEPGVQERFNRGVANALRTPPKPHRFGEKVAGAATLPKKGRRPKPAPKE